MGTVGLCSLQDLHLKQLLLQQAADKLKSSMQFSRADADPANALGDVVMDAAELIIQLHNITSRCGSQAASMAVSSTAMDLGGSLQTVSSSGFGGQAALPDEVAAQAASLVQQAASDGFMAALTINRTNADALVSWLLLRKWHTVR